MDQEKNQNNIPNLSLIDKCYYTSYEIWVILFLVFALLRVNCSSPVMDSQFWLSAGTLVPIFIRLLFETIAVVESKVFRVQYIGRHRKLVTTYLLNWHFCWYLVGLTVYFTIDSCDFGYFNYKMKLQF